MNHLENMNYSLQEILNGTARLNQHNDTIEKSNVNKLIGICYVPMQEWEYVNRGTKIIRK